VDWIGCHLGDCNEFFVKIVSAINPDPTREVVLENIEIAGGRLFAQTLPGMGLEGTADAVLGGGIAGGAGEGGGGGRGGLRLELWRRSAAAGPRRVAVIAEFEPSMARLGDLSLGRFLVITPPERTGLPLEIDASWLPGAPDLPDADGDRVPDPFDNCAEQPNADQLDQDLDGIGDACQRGGGQLPGDCNQDKTVDLSDMVCLFGYLFTGRPDGLPCGDQSSEHAANLALIDWNGDLDIDISDGVGGLGFLFQGGPAHARGRQCTAIAGCPTSCGAE
jgi:hypothetical protein